eukprot:3014261-Pleurochrysis_carterae.AAC.3
MRLRLWLVPKRAHWFLCPVRARVVCAKAILRPPYRERDDEGAAQALYPRHSGPSLHRPTLCIRHVSYRTHHGMRRPEFCVRLGCLARCAIVYRTRRPKAA